MAEPQPSPNAIPVARKIKKVLKTMRCRRRLIGRAPSSGGGNVSKRQTSVNARKFGFHFEKIQFIGVANRQHNPPLGDTFRWLDGPIFVFSSFMARAGRAGNVSARTFPECAGVDPAGLISTRTLVT
jgi:hypothetical protein